MRQIFRRNTSPIGMAETPIGFGVPNKVEKLKSGPGYRFRERDRVRIIAPPQFAHQTGHIVESSDVQNDQGLLEIELDFLINEETGDGYSKLTDPNIPRQRITIKNPDKQLRPYKYMKCQSQHFKISLRAESLLQISLIGTFILGFDVISFLFGINNGEWKHNELFITFLICNTLSISFGFYCILILSFTGFTIKRISILNNLPQIGSVHDDCTSYQWFNSQSWKPWWLCGRDIPSIQFILQQTAKIYILFILFFILSIILYIGDHTEWYIMLICIFIITIPLIFALQIIKNNHMIQFA
eukprot:754941_1